MAVQEEPGGWPPSFLILTSAVGARRRPAPPWQASCNLPSPAPPTTQTISLGFCTSQPSMAPTCLTPRLQALAVSYCLHPQRSPVTLSRRMTLPAPVQVAPPGQSLCQWLLPHQTLSLGQWGGLQATPDGISSSTPSYYIPSSPCSWISSSFLGGSGCNLIFLSLLQG